MCTGSVGGAVAGSSAAPAPGASVYSLIGATQFMVAPPLSIVSTSFPLSLSDLHVRQSTKETMLMTTDIFI